MTLNFHYELVEDTTNEWHSYFIDPNNTVAYMGWVYMGLIVENDNGTFTAYSDSIVSLVDETIMPELIPKEFNQKDHASIQLLALDTTPERINAINEAKTILNTI